MAMQVGGSFAPSLTADKLQAYRELAETAQPAIKEMMTGLIKMVDVFQETPPSTLPGTSLRIGRVTALKTPLAQAEIERIWDHVPWDHEVRMYTELAESVQQAEAQRNSAKISEWGRQVTAHISRKHFPEDGLYEKICEALRTAAKWIGLMTPDHEAKVKEMGEKANACNAEIHQALTSKSYAEIPYPTLESVELRNAAFHLLWYARELERDREPMTNDQLVIG
jgi:hypothetical protein